MRKIRLQPPEQQEKRAPVPTSILVIDDSPTICKIIEIILKQAGYSVNTFLDGVAALAWLASKEAVLPELVFLDTLMPKMNGYQVARHLKSKPALAGIKIVLMSRCDGQVDRLKARLCGANEYVTKPFTAGGLLSLTQQLLKQ